MGDIDVNIEVNGIKKVGDLLEDALEEGAEDSVDYLVDVGRHSARRILVANDLVWTTELYRSIKTTTSSGKNSYSGTVLADSRHAAPIEFGADYDTEGPPVSALIPWVKAKLADWNVDFDSDFDNRIYRDPDERDPTPKLEPYPDAKNEPGDFDPAEGKYDLDYPVNVTYQRERTTADSSYTVTRHGRINQRLTDDDDEVYYRINEEDGGEVFVYPDQVTTYDGAGTDYEKVDIGDSISTGNEFGEVIEKFDSTEGIKVRYENGTEDLLEDWQIRKVEDQYVSTPDPDDMGRGDGEISPSDFDPTEGKENLSVGESVVYNYANRGNAGEIKYVSTDRYEDFDYKVTKRLKDGWREIDAEQILSYENQNPNPKELKKGDVVSDGNKFGRVVYEEDKWGVVWLKDEIEFSTYRRNRIKLVDENFDPFEVSDYYTTDKDRLEYGEEYTLDYKSVQSGNIISKNVEAIGSGFYEFDYDGEKTYTHLLKDKDDGRYLTVEETIDENGVQQRANVYGYSVIPQSNTDSLNTIGKRDIQIIPKGKEKKYRPDKISLDRGKWNHIDPEDLRRLERGDIVRWNWEMEVMDVNERGVTVGYNENKKFEVEFHSTGKAFIATYDDDGEIKDEEPYVYEGAFEVYREEETEDVIGHHLREDEGVGVEYQTLVTRGDIEADPRWTDTVSIYSEEDVEKYLGSNVLVRTDAGDIQIKNAKNTFDVGTGYNLYEKNGDRPRMGWYVPSSSYYGEGNEIIAVPKEPGATPSFFDQSEVIEELREDGLKVANDYGIVKDRLQETDEYGDRWENDSIIAVTSKYLPENGPENQPERFDVNTLIEYTGTKTEIFEDALEQWKDVNKYAAPGEGKVVSTDALERLIHISKNSEGYQDFNYRRVGDSFVDSIDPGRPNYERNKFPEKELPNGDSISRVEENGFEPKDFLYGRGDVDYNPETDGYIGQKVAIYDDGEITNFILSDTFEEDSIVKGIYRQEGGVGIRRGLPHDKKIVAGTINDETDVESLDSFIDTVDSYDTSEIDNDKTLNLFKKELSRLYSNDSRDIESVGYNILKFEDVDQNPNKSNNVIGYLGPLDNDKTNLPALTIGLNEKKVGNVPDGKIFSTIRHEAQHGSQILNKHVHADGLVNKKVDQLNNEKYIQYNFIQDGPKTGDPTSKYGYGPGYDHVIGKADETPREDVFDTWFEDVRENLESGLNGRAEIVDYQDVSASDIDPEPGDFIRVKDDLKPTADYYKVKSVEETAEGGYRIKALDRRNGINLVEYNPDGFNIGGDITGYAPNLKGPQYRTYHDPDENPDLAFREVVSRTWYRMALASETETDSNQTPLQKKDIISKWAIEEDTYSLYNPMETEAVAVEIFQADKSKTIQSNTKSYGDVVSELVRYHPDLIYAYYTWYEGFMSQRFKERLKHETNKDSIEEVMEELRMRADL